VKFDIDVILRLREEEKSLCGRDWLGGFIFASGEVSFVFLWREKKSCVDLRRNRGDCSRALFFQ